LKILHIISTTGTGGAELSLSRLVNSMDRSHFTNTVISMMRPGETGRLIRDSGIELFSLDMANGRPETKSILKLRKIISDLNPDIIQCWMYHANLIGLFSGGNAKLFWNIRCSDFDHSLYGKIYRLTVKANALFSRSPSCIIVNSDSGKSYHEKIGFKARRWEVIHNGFNTKLFKPDKHAGLSERNALGIPEGAVVIGLIARFDPLKDHETFFIAADMLARHYPQAIFILAGKDVTKDNSVIMRQIRGNTANYHLLGERSDINQILPALDISVSSSISEGMPNVVGEAMACGVPCVVTDVGDSKYLVGDTGIVVPKKNPKALFNGIKQLIDAGPEHRARLGEAARKRIIENFSLDKFVKRYESLYQEYVK